MDTAHWTKLRIKTLRTKKKFFGKYLYKLKVLAPGSRLINYNRFDSIASGIEDRINYIESIGTTYGGSTWFRQRALKRIENASVEQLEYLKTVKENNTELNFRIEEPYVSIYAKNEQDLFTLVQGLPDKSSAVEISRPYDQQSIDILNRGETITRKPVEYEYKVLFKEHRVTNRDNLIQIYNYLSGLGSDVKILPSCKRNLTTNLFWFSQCYFYTKDPGVCTFINLIAPNLIKEISKLTKVE